MTQELIYHTIDHSLYLVLTCRDNDVTSGWGPTEHEARSSSAPVEFCPSDQAGLKFKPIDDHESRLVTALRYEEQKNPHDIKKLVHSEGVYRAIVHVGPFGDRVLAAKGTALCEETESAQGYADEMTIGPVPNGTGIWIFKADAVRLVLERTEENETTYSNRFHGVEWIRANDVTEDLYALISDG